MSTPPPPSLVLHEREREIGAPVPCRIIFVPGKKRSGRNVRIIIFVPVYTVIFVPATVQCVLNF